MADNYSLYELNEYIRRVVALNFQETIWVRCEISQASHSRGSVYLNVVQTEEISDTIKAQANAVIWPRSYIFLQKKLGELLPFILENGSEVLIKVNIDFHERYGLKLVVEDIDASYTIGQAEMARQKIIERLKKEGLLNLNDNRQMPAVLQSIAVISSETAAGYKDFEHQIADNNFGYEISIDLYNTAVQGRNVESDVLAALIAIKDSGKQYDVITIIRGGGSKLDLAGFDNYNIGHAISQCQWPVIIGIGHEIDTTVTDLVAHTSLKTPTAVANYIIDRNMTFESSILDIGYKIQQASYNLINIETADLNHSQQLLNQGTQQRLQSENHSLDHTYDHLRYATKTVLGKWNQYLQSTTTLINLVDPKRTLQRGFSIIRQEGKAINSIQQMEKGKSIEVVMKDGSKEFVEK